MCIARACQKAAYSAGRPGRDPIQQRKPHRRPLESEPVQLPLNAFQLRRDRLWPAMLQCGMVATEESRADLLEPGAHSVGRPAKAAPGVADFHRRQAEKAPAYLTQNTVHGLLWLTVYEPKY